MEKQKILLNNKQVWASEPYKPNPSMMPAFVGREKEMELIMASWIAGPQSLPLSPVLVGEPGVGKNRIIYELARFTGRDLFLAQGHEDITAEDLACSVRFSDDTANLMEYVLSPLVCAMMNGGIFFLDEIGKIRPRALALLVSVLDERRYIDSTLLCERVFAKPGFRFIAATNTGEVGMLPEFIRSRMRPVIKIDFPPRQEIEEIIHQQFSSRMENLSSLVERFWFLWDKKGSSGTALTPRDAIAVFSMASSISGFESQGIGKKLRTADNTDSTALDSIDLHISVTYKHLEKAVNELYG
jgi:Holliday junction resolvasome RuvABC ATP-dependent DNA helicase subunit